MACFFGIGVGQIIDDMGNKSLRFKTGIGLWGYLTFDYSSFEDLKYNFGAIGVLPILVPILVEEKLTTL